MKKISSALFLVALSTLACSTSEVNPVDKPEVINVEEPIWLKIKGYAQPDEITLNCSSSITETAEAGSILHKRYEDMTFDVRTKTLKDAANGHIKQTVETIDRKGPGSLHDLAFPELGEVLSFELDSAGNIFKAGDFPKDSLFFLPAVPLPLKPVKVGDKWIQKNSWRAEGSSLELSVELDMTLERFEKCGSHRCANVAVTGKVFLPQEVASKIKFSHSITGRFLFSEDAGLVVWSEFGSDELMQGAKVTSRLRSVLVSPHGFRTPNREEPNCPFESKAK